MTPTRAMAAAAAGILVSGLAVVTTSTPTQAQPGDRSGDRSGDRAGAPFTVTARVTETEPEQGDTIKIRGSVKPVRPGSRSCSRRSTPVTRSGRTSAHGQLNALGKFRFKDEVDSVRFRKYRVVKAADRKRSLGTSDKLGVTVFGWRDLTSLGPVAGSGTRETDSVTINAKSYAQSVVGSTLRQLRFPQLQHQPGLQVVLRPARAGRQLGGHRHRPGQPVRRRRGALLEQLRPDAVGGRHRGPHRRLPDHLRVDVVQHRGHAGGPVRSHRRDGVTAVLCSF